MKIVEKTYKASVRRFSKKANNNFVVLVDFVKKLKLNGKQFDELCSIVDGYTDLNAEIREYAYKNKIDVTSFFEDINNSAFNVKYPIDIP